MTDQRCCHKKLVNAETKNQNPNQNQQAIQANLMNEKYNNTTHTHTHKTCSPYSHTKTKIDTKEID